MRKLVVIVILGVLVWWAYHHFAAPADKPAAPKAPAVKVSVAPAKRANVPLTLQLAGNVIPYETVAVKSRLDSVVTEVAFHDGDHVAQGQVLFKLDDRSLKAQLSQLQATVQKEQAQLADLKLQFERAKLLVVNKAIAQAAYDTANAAYISQQAAVSEAQATLDNTKVLLSYTTITAPIEGRAGTINVTLGNNVKANDAQALVTINRVTPIRAQFAIPERYYEQVRTAMAQSIPVKAVRDNAAEQPQGKLEYIDNTIDPTTGAFIARAIFTNEKEALWPGMFVTVTLDLLHEDNVLTVPAVAVQGDTGNNFVFKAMDGKAVKTPVEISRMSGEVAIVTKGLNDGENVLVDGLMRVMDGAVIEIPAAAPPAEKPAT